MAQGFTLQGRAQEAVERLRQITPASWEGTERSLGNHDTVYGWSQASYLHAASFVHSHLGDATEAEVAQREALRLYSPADQRQRALVQLHSAVCAAQQNNVGDAVAHAMQVISRLAPQQRTAMVLEIGQHVLDRVPINERSRGLADELRSLLALPAAGEAV